MKLTGESCNDKLFFKPITVTYVGSGEGLELGLMTRSFS